MAAALPASGRSYRPRLRDLAPAAAARKVLGLVDTSRWNITHETGRTPFEAVIVRLENTANHFAAAVDREGCRAVAKAANESVEAIKDFAEALHDEAVPCEDLLGRAEGYLERLGVARVAVSGARRLEIADVVASCDAARAVLAAKRSERDAFLAQWEAKGSCVFTRADGTTVTVSWDEREKDREGAAAWKRQFRDGGGYLRGGGTAEAHDDQMAAMKESQAKRNRRPARVEFLAQHHDAVRASHDRPCPPGLFRLSEGKYGVDQVRREPRSDWPPYGPYELSEALEVLESIGFEARDVQTGYEAHVSFMLAQLEAGTPPWRLKLPHHAVGVPKSEYRAKKYTWYFATYRDAVAWKLAYKYKGGPATVPSSPSDWYAKVLAGDRDMPSYVYADDETVGGDPTVDKPPRST